jgi:hypothetical protein
MFGKSDEDIQLDITMIDGLGGMTVNERLYVSGLTRELDAAMIQDKARARDILTWLKVDKFSIDQIVKRTNEI